MSLRQQIRFFLSWLTSVYLLAVVTSTQAAELNLASSPLFLGTQIDPNIFFMLDDSGSMDWEILTHSYVYYDGYWSSGGDGTAITSGLFEGNADSGSCTGRRAHAYVYSNAINTDNLYNFCSLARLEEEPQTMVRDWRVRDAALNIMYYDPSATYQPWESYSDASFTAARSNPEAGSAGYLLIRDLTGFIYEVSTDDKGFTGAEPTGTSNVTDGANELVDLWDSHITYTVNSTAIDVVDLTTGTAASIIALARDCNLSDANDSPQYKDCYGSSTNNTSISGAGEDPYGRTVTQAQQNVANWYQYHRRRSFVAKAAIANVISSNNSFRFGLSLLNESGTLFVQVPLAAVDDYESHNADLITEMFEFDWLPRGTPLRRGLEMVGLYYSDYYSGTYVNPIISACQQNYAVLFTDGYWSGSAPITAAIGNEDGDGATDTLADVAHYFYNTDLSPLPDDVPTTTLDPNEAQHMVSFTVAFGVEGNLVDTDDDNYPNPTLEEDGAWSSGAVNTDAEKIDDLWHAAFNSKGYFVSAQTTSGVANAISDALLEIADRVGSSASVATNTGSLNAGSKLFQARFDSSDWKGQLLAFTINLDGTIDPDEDWEAGERVDAQNYDTVREIITWNPDIDDPIGGPVEGKAIPFRFPSDYNLPSSSEMNSVQIGHLLTNAPYSVSTMDVDEIDDNQTYGEDIVNYLRGDQANEGELGQQFRLRNSVLGDIVNSDPIFVQAPIASYPDLLEVKSYDDFITDNASRDGVVYAGANDGMLHGFDETTGDEVIAFIPSAVYQNLDELPSEDYIHRYFVDASPNIIDVFLDDMIDPASATNGLWRTVLVGGLGGGGQAIYALDVTDPSIFDEANADSIVLWEFDDGDDVDLGYTYGRPQLAKMADGTWAAIFGNGYNNTAADGTASTSGHAVLYIVDVETGALLKKIDTEAGSAATPNGLATPLLIDQDADFVVDYIYAGDLLGNLWKFDVTDGNPSNWDVAYDTGGTPDPLFTAETGQEITSQPQASFHPDNLGGFMIFFGTGKYLETSDNDSISQTTQSFYGIWDKNEGTLAAFSRSDLLQQSISNQFEKAFDTDADEIDDETFTLRDVTDFTIDWGMHMGWYLDLMPDNIESVANSDNFGERQVSSSIVRNGRIIFTTLVPSTVECEFGGMSFLMQLDFRDGSALEFPAFDLNNDGEYDADDTSVSGRASNVGIMPSISILSDGAQDIAFGSGASGDIDVIQLSIGNQAYGRQSWRQLE